MLNHSILLDINPQLGLLNNIYQDTSNVFRDSRLSNYIQIAVSEVFAAAGNKSLFSIDLERLCNTDELRIALASKPHNYLRAVNLEGVHHALDISEDIGGIAHYLADKVATLDSVKIDSDRTRLALLRCANKQNICHICEDLQKLTLPRKHYDLIVVGELEALQLSRDDQAKLLAQLQAALTARGVLILNVKNRERITKWLNCDNQEIPFQALYNTDFEQEYDRKELLDTLAEAQFSAIRFNATFSTAKHCQNLFSEEYLTSNPNALNHFYRLGAVSNQEINEYLLFKNLFNNQERVFDLASRFVVFAAANAESAKRLYHHDFCHFAGSSRKPKWRTQTSRRCSASEVIKQSLYPEASPQQTDTPRPRVTQNLAAQPFCLGRLLVDDWLAAIYQNQATAFRGLITEYAEWLGRMAADPKFNVIAYDLLPFNIIVNTSGETSSYQIIDPEWQIDADFDSNFVLFRALFWFAFENKSLLRGFCKQNAIFSIAMFVVRFMPGVEQTHELQAFVELEEAIQAQIDNNFRAKAVQHALLQTFDQSETASDASLKCQVMWGNSNGVVDEKNSVFKDWQASGEKQTLEIVLPQYQKELPLLRVDPISNKGLFSLSSVVLKDAQQNILYMLDSATAIAEVGELVHLMQTVTATGQNGFVALNDDPHILFSLAHINEPENVRTLELEISLQHDEFYDAALSTLSTAVNRQNGALQRQSNALNEYRAEIEYTNLRLAEVIAHRTDLQDIRQSLAQELKLKNDQLNAQLCRNQEMEDYLMMRPSTRAKRFATRSLGKLTKKTTLLETPNQEQEGEATPLDPDGLPMSGELIGQNTEDYPLWVSENTLSESDIEHIKREIEALDYKPVFSILVPIYNTDPDYLIPMIRSVQAQIYPHWQLCLVDDASPKSYLKSILEHEASLDKRISIQLNQRNQGISLTSNDALALATGDYIALLDHDDELSIDALYENVKAINQFPQLGLAYSDEDKMDMQGNRLEPYFKPDYSPDLLETNNYICHLTVIKKDIVDEIGGFQEGLDGSQDHDLILRAIQLSERVVHIPKILYHWRKIPGSTAEVYDAKSYAWEAGRKAVENCLNKRERGVAVKFGSLKGTYRVFREIQGEPLVSIIIPFKDKPELLEACLSSILSRTTYKNFEVIGVSNSSEQAATFAKMEHFQALDERITFVEKNIAFNFSALCNYGVAQANGDYVVLLNNDIEIQSVDWLERLLEHAQRPTTGAVGGKLLYPDGRIQHAGVVAGMVGAAGHPHKFFPDNHIGYHGRLHMVYNVSAVTGAMMMLSTEKYHQVGGLDETHLAIAYNDIDLCLKLLDQGYLNVFTPHCKATHYESVSRGYEDTPEKLARLNREQAHFLAKWRDFLASGDPYYNPNLSLKNERFSLNFKD